MIPDSHESEYPCGHAVVTTGCGGCDPGAIEFVIPDGADLRRGIEPFRVGAAPTRPHTGVLMGHPLAELVEEAREEASKGRYDQARKLFAAVEIEARRLQGVLSP